MSTKEPKRIKQILPILISVIVLTNVLVFYAGQVFAGNAVALKDSELDSVYAEGLSFKFDVSLVNPDTLFKNSPTAGYNQLASGSVVANTQRGGAAQIEFDVIGNPSSQASNLTSDPTEMLLSGNSSRINTVIVGDNSQQYLSSLVNVNSAGSFVPILINIVININSTIDNLSNVNSLNLDDFYRYQLR